MSIGQLSLLSTYVAQIFPQVKKRLLYWEKKAMNIPDPYLREQALSSLRQKAFHCLGGSVYALYPRGGKDSLNFIIALQTISDYLDNLCDRTEFLEEDAFWQLHQAFFQALDLEKNYIDYYKYYPYQEDGGYLEALVMECKNYLHTLPAFPLIQEKLFFLATIYSKLQTYKHLASADREGKLREWLQGYMGEDYKEYELLAWNELALATGSTLTIFILVVSASREDLKKEEVEKVFQAYFPWVQCLHIFLDYYIDLKEDEEHGDLNFVAYFEGEEERLKSLEKIVGNTFKAIEKLAYYEFHETIMLGLLAMYLSDSKVERHQVEFLLAKLERKIGKKAKRLYSSCKLLRRLQIL